MNANSTYYIGKDHIACEDYALAYTSAGLSYAIVSDGCSASNDVDFGSRCLAMSAKRELRLNNNPSNAVNFGLDAITNAQRVIDVFPYLSPTFLDATLLVAWVKDGKAQFYMYGDGVVVSRSAKTGKVVGYHVQLSSGAPDYLSYNLDPMRCQAYEAIEYNKKVITVYDNQNGVMTSEGKPLMPYVGTWKVEEGDIIAVVSDGINSFRKMNNDIIPWTDLIDEFTGYKTVEGEFVARRIAAFKRKCLKEGITHSDDISAAAIVV